MEEVRGPRDEFGRAFEAAFARIQIRVEEVCTGRQDWPDGVAQAIDSALAFAAADPEAAQVLTNGALAHGSDGFARYDRMLAYFGERLAPGREMRPWGERLPEITERAMAGGIAMLVAQRLDLGEAGSLPSLAEEAIQFVLTPYLGGEDAKRVAAAHR